MPVLKNNPNLKDIQKYVQELESERGFSEETVLQKCILIGEELGELFRAIRKKEGIKTDKASVSDPIGEELADLIVYICAIANRYNINLEEEFRKKEEINKKRVWN